MNNQYSVKLTPLIELIRQGKLGSNYTDRFIVLPGETPWWDIDDSKERTQMYHRQYSRKSYNDDPELYKERWQKWYQNNKEYVKEYYKKRYQDNKESICERNRRWYENNREHATERNRRWRENNKERVREYARLYYLINHDRIREDQKQIICPICNTAPAVSPHHIKPQRENGSDKSWNIVYLCKQCHDVVEEIYDKKGICYSPMLARLLQLYTAHNVYY